MAGSRRMVKITILSAPGRPAPSAGAVAEFTSVFGCIM
jgi:hypothetical protein